MAFTILSWNVEHFGKTSANSAFPSKPIAPIINYINSFNADIVAIYEVVGKTIFDEIMEKMPGYQFYITEGPQTQEILVGVKNNINSFFTQKTTFKSSEPALRPGALITIRLNNKNYSILFLHLKSSAVPKGFGLRDDMVGRVIKLKKTLDELHLEKGFSGKSNFICLGDLNTMGMNITYSDKDISAEDELERIEKRLKVSSVGMKKINKSVEQTYWPGSSFNYPIGNLDHVFAADHINFTEVHGKSVQVKGWVEKGTNPERDDWANEFSDHALLYFEVHEV